MLPAAAKVNAGRTAGVLALLLALLGTPLAAEAQPAASPRWLGFLLVGRTRALTTGQRQRRIAAT